MFSARELDEIFRIGVDEPATPCTIFGKDGINTDTAIVFDREPKPEPILDAQVSTAAPEALIRTRDANPTRILNAKILVHGMLLLQTGLPLLLEDGTYIITRGIYTYYIVDVRRNADGTSLLILSEDLP